MEIYLYIAIALGLLTIVSFLKVRKHDSSIYTWKWSFLIGAFVWEDVLIFSLYFCIAALVTYFTALKVGFVLFFVFWFLRGHGESRYFMLQQLISQDETPHDVRAELMALRFIFGKLDKNQALIILQIFHQTISMLALAGLILIVLNWSAL